MLGSQAPESRRLKLKRSLMMLAIRRSLYSRRLLSLAASSMQCDSPRPDHLQRTANNTRAVNESQAVVKTMTDLSPTVKSLTLHIVDKTLCFLPGQWVDFMIPGVETVGGFSMSTAPHTLKDRQELDLAIKASIHPPAHWVHTQCRVGSEVKLRVGGDFFYAPSAGQGTHNLLLVAGGVGVNPLYSILQHAAHQQAAAVKVTFLYSAQTHEELIFKDQIEQLASSNGDIKCHFYVTRQKDERRGVKYGRIDKAVVEKELHMLQQGGTPVTSYLCGPGPMMNTLESYLQQLRVPQSHIVYEKWW